MAKAQYGAHARFVAACIAENQRQAAEIIAPYVSPPEPSAAYPRKSITSGPEDGRRVVYDVSVTDWGPIPGTPVHVFEINGGPTMTVNIEAGDPDDPTWTDLDVR